MSAIQITNESLLTLANFLLVIVTFFLYKVTKFGAEIAKETAIETTHNVNRDYWVNIYFEYNRRFSEILRNLPSDFRDPTFDFKKLKDKELDDFSRNMIIYFNLCLEEFYLNKRGWIETNIWEGWKAGIKNYMRLRSFKDAWESMKNNDCYTEDFRKFMDKI